MRRIWRGLMLTLAALMAVGIGVGLLQQQFPALSGLANSPPPQAMMSQTVVGPYGQVMAYTVQQLTERLSHIPGLNSSWSSDPSGDWIFRVSGMDQMTEQQTNFVFRFRDSTVVQLAENGVYLTDLAVLGELESL